MLQWLMVSLLSLVPVQHIADLEVASIAFDGADFRDAFNVASDRPRLVVVSSPTCPSCLQKVADVEEILSRYPQARIQVFVLWAPYMQTDNRPQAQRASAYMTDRRARHFWDLWRFGTRSYSEQMNIPPRYAWDMLAFYEPHLVWRDSPPEPTFWMHALSDFGTAYNKSALEAGLRRSLER
jgi:hypothetical protein